MASTLVAAVADVPEDGSYLFTVRDEDGEEQEAILVRDGDEAGGVRAWLNYCQHFTHIKLDKGRGAPIREGEIICANHGAMFEVDSGECTFGPCEGAYLNGLDIRVEDGDVYLDDEGFEFAYDGGIETDPTDLSSTSNVEF
ncbi:Rieske (2Fe-2S) protein [Halocalculus aciditolerans]|uniref:(2Fe-2S) ferredoxin n=1 Tax=Halocalculus aciditolerans TaxID=1383812 RepID=A0A830F7U4_9EURY|nr:Rieske 2Fe-2S domain-containing protein [Halocalculus aciditolerans]GGL63239.1 (2Fe-2S) ferredoxin [Halocalculus aciditolerans]